MGSAFRQHGRRWPQLPLADALPPSRPRGRELIRSTAASDNTRPRRSWWATAAPGLPLFWRLSGLWRRSENNLLELHSRSAAVAADLGPFLRSHAKLCSEEQTKVGKCCLCKRLCPRLPLKIV